MSEKTSELFTAFAKFQGELSNAAKAKDGHGYKYADLARCIDTAKDHLQLNGLAVSQLMGKSDSGVTLTTILTHASGQWMRDTFVMEKATLQGGAGKNPAQAMGASITYMRRYAYAAILGMAQDDEDAVSKKQVLKHVLNAIANNDESFIRNAWDNDIANIWPDLNLDQVNKLNSIMNIQGN